MRLFLNLQAKVLIMANEVEQIQQMIYEIRGQKVMIDSDLAAMYGVETKRLKEAVRRNIKRFEGDDFMFTLTKDEAEQIRSRSQIATLNKGQENLSGSQALVLNTGRGSNLKYLPFAFTELGVAMLSSVLHSETAIDINRKIMRAFVELRRFVGMVSTDYVELKKEIMEVRNYIEDILADQNDINEEHSAQLEAISLALVELQSNHPQKERRRIGFRLSDGTDQ